ncbi:unnamed protein product [Mytilus coruscus]|uniref:Uncharacterized protein n=1 Tax=Mytilus coruscus TaxID=42192 RepID=A0A6J7ZXN0_MYTCO|nr:unnamed protein product [Mytilus coruscus]
MVQISKYSDSLFVIMMASVFEQSYKENNHLIGAERSPGIQRQTLSYVISNVIHVDRNVTYQPIRIHVIYCMYFELSVEDRERIIGIVIKAVGKISQLLSEKSQLPRSSSATRNTVAFDWCVPWNILRDTPDLTHVQPEVFPVQQPVLLKRIRSGCHKEWTTGPNKGRFQMTI